MNSEELKKNFSLLMPSEINGFKRPKEPIANDNDFFLEVPQLIQKDPVLYSTMNLILGVLVSNDKLLKQWHDTLQNVVNAQDWRVVTDSLKGYMTPELKKKLDGIAAGANNYIHPSTHPASMITQDTTHRFVTDTEKTTWNGKASTAVVSTTANGLMPKRDGSATSIFTGDGVWKSLAWNLITGKPSTFAPSAHNHDSSYLKRNQTTQNDMNVCTVEGIYRFSGNLSNAWTGTSWGTLLVFNNNYNGGSGTGGTYLVQMALPTDGRIWIRQRVNTEAWSGWVKVAITSDTVAGATKATQDSQGQAINTTYIKSITASNATLTLTKGNGTTSTVTINNVGNSTRATQDKNGKDITGYLYKTEDLTLNSNAEILTVGNISEILNSFCTKFKQIQGTGTYAENSPTSIKSLNDNKAPKASPAFSGTPTSPTPATSDNSTKIATTEFVRNLINQFKNDGTLGGIVGGSLTQNGWVKFSNGPILQWGLSSNSSSGDSNIEVVYPITFSNIYCVVPNLFSTTASYNNAGGGADNIISSNSKSFIFHHGSDVANCKLYWIAIGT